MAGERGWDEEGGSSGGQKIPGVFIWDCLLIRSCMGLTVEFRCLDPDETTCRANQRWFPTNVGPVSRRRPKNVDYYFVRYMHQARLSYVSQPYTFILGTCILARADHCKYCKGIKI